MHVILYLEIPISTKEELSMKKLCVWILVFSMCLAFVGCETALPEVSEDGSSVEQTTAATTSTATVETTAPSGETAPTDEYGSPS